MRTLTWPDFDRAVETIAHLCGGEGYSGIHGIPRGGLVLAVALSHRLDLPLLPEPRAGCVVVDDIYESGLTLEPFRQLADTRVVVWISKAEPTWWQAVETSSSSEWVLFPWEQRGRAEADAEAYRRSRVDP